MNFTDYLIKTKEIANEERDILDFLAQKESLTPIEIRAVKSSMQVIIENLIGKSKRVLKEFDCPIIPQRGRDAITILYEVGAINENQYHSFVGAIGFRNSMIHEYMEFNIEILLDVLREKRYLVVYDFLIEEPIYRDVILKRIKSFSF